MSSFRLRRKVAFHLMLSGLGILVCHVAMGVNWMKTEYSSLEYYRRDGMLLGLWLLVIVGQLVFSVAITTPPASPCFPKRYPWVERLTQKGMKERALENIRRREFWQREKKTTP